jgi:hypothetical protein
MDGIREAGADFDRIIKMISKAGLFFPQSY